MKKPINIVVTEPMGLSADQVKQLESFGKTTTYNELAKTSDEWVDRCKDTSIICSGKYGLKDKIYDLSDVFVSLPFVSVDWLDTNRLSERNIVVSYSPGCNKEAVSEWIITMVLLLLRQIDQLIKVESLEDKIALQKYLGLSSRKVCVLGTGNIGSLVVKLCQVFDMKVTSFGRGDNLVRSVKDADVVINTLGSNSTTAGLLDKKFFYSLKKGSFFITVTSSKVYDSTAMLQALDDGILAGVADDVGGILPGNVNDSYYMQLLKHPKVITTPHISFQSDTTARTSNEIMMDNVEAWIKGKPINLMR